jgi:hypothetical protein
LVLLIVLAAGLIGGLVIWWSRRKADWDAAAAALASDTRAAVGTRLPPVLAAVAAAQRALSWTPLRADLIDLVRRWSLLAENAPGERARDWSRRVGSLLQEAVAAMDAENEALATGGEWRLLRPRLDDAARALSAALDEQPRPEPAHPGPDDDRGGPNLG